MYFDCKQASKTDASRGDALSKDEESKANKLDSNIITPGTEFMELLSSALRYYVHLKMNSDPGWRGIKVVIHLIVVKNKSLKVWYDLTVLMFFRLYCLMLVCRVKVNIKPCLTSACKGTCLDMIPIHDIVCMDWCVMHYHFSSDDATNFSYLLILTTQKDRQ